MYRQLFPNSSVWSEFVGTEKCYSLRRQGLVTGEEVHTEGTWQDDQMLCSEVDLSQIGLRSWLCGGTSM